MTDPSVDPDLVEHLDDHSLLTAYERARGEPGGNAPDALLAEIERRGLRL